MSLIDQRVWAWPYELQQAGILGINRRNCRIIGERNPRRLYPRVDNKLLTKEICQAHDIPVPETYHVLRAHADARRFLSVLGDRSDFVVKPARGAAGRGILVIADRTEHEFLTPGGRVIHWSDLRYHLATAISGLYSLGGQMDEVIIEQRLVSHPALTAVAVGGTPDIRVIVYRGIPAMAMTRLPTGASGGRANLHQGAVAAAVDLATGQTFGGVMKNRVISVHPDTGAPIAGIQIPNWKELLTAAMKLSDALEMGYVGVDFVVDAIIGPVVLEANARPGLAIQVAHQQGLRPRLEFIDQFAAEHPSCDERWEILGDLASRFGRLTSAVTLGAVAARPPNVPESAAPLSSDEAPSS